MQNEIQTPAITIVPAHSANAPSAKPETAPAQPIVGIETVSAITEADAAKRKLLAEKLAAKRLAASTSSSKPAKPAKQPASANGKAAAKRVSAKPAKPTAEAREAAQREQNDARRLARDAASKAVAAFYTGASRPFKAASDRFADINTSNAKSATTRQAGLMLALITYGAGNMQPDGSFVRGGFNVPARLVNPNAKPGEFVRAQPESGCLGNMLGRTVDFVRGPTSGREQSAAVYKLRIKPALAEIAAAFGDKQRNAAEKLLASYAKRGAKPEATA